jgi:hypothetical protein
MNPDLRRPRLPEHQQPGSAGPTVDDLAATSSTAIRASTAAPCSSAAAPCASPPAPPGRDDLRRDNECHTALDRFAMRFQHWAGASSIWPETAGSWRLWAHSRSRIAVEVPHFDLCSRISGELVTAHLRRNAMPAVQVPVDLLHWVLAILRIVALLVFLVPLRWRAPEAGKTGIRTLAGLSPVSSTA